MSGTEEGEYLTRLGALAVREGMIGPEDLTQCVRRQVRLQRQGVHLRLGQLLVQEDLISTSQLVQLLGMQRRMRAASR